MYALFALAFTGSLFATLAPHLVELIAEAGLLPSGANDSLGDSYDRWVALTRLFGIASLVLAILALARIYLEGDLNGLVRLGGEFAGRSDDLSLELEGQDKVDMAVLSETATKQVGAAPTRLSLRFANDPGAARLVLRREIQRLFEGTRTRISSEILNLRRQARTNLLLGGGTTLTAVLILAWLALGTPVEIKEPYWLSAVTGYVPRLGLAIFIQVFAFFFLRLYRAGLAEIKYFQNELTNVESAMIALTAAIAIDDSDAVDAILLRLSTNERNFVLKAGESTVELEHLRHENDGLKHLVGALSVLRADGKEAIGRGK